MGLHNCLEKKKFRNEQQKMLVNLLLSASWVNEKMKKFLCPEGITYQQYNILRILEDSEKPLSILQIRDLMVDKMSDASRIVDRLVLKNLVKKCVCPIDKRLVDISLTGEGEDLLCHIDQRLNEIDLLCHTLTDNDVKLLNDLLNKMRDEHPHPAPLA